MIYCGVVGRLVVICVFRVFCYLCICVSSQVAWVIRFLLFVVCGLTWVGCVDFVSGFVIWVVFVNLLRFR